MKNYIVWVGGVVVYESILKSPSQAVSVVRHWENQGYDDVQLEVCDI